MVAWLTGLIFFLSVYQNAAQHDYFSSISGLEKLLAAEENLLISMEQYLKKFDGNLDVINNFISNIDEILNIVDEKTYENPLSSLKAFKRIAIDWLDAESVMLTNGTTVLEEEYAIAQKMLPAPVTFEDLNGAAEAISRLQFTYNLKAQDLADGIINGQQASSPMSADDCAAMAYHMYQVEQFSNANEWFFIAKNKLKQEETMNYDMNVFPYLEKELLYTRLVPSLIYSGNLKLAEKFNTLLHQLQPQGTAVENDNHIKQEILKERQSPSKSWMKPKEEPMYKKVCSGELRQTPREQRNLRCRYVCNRKHSCFISPFKFEELNLDPPVGYFYDVIYDNEIQTIRNVTEELLVRSTVGEEGERSKIRTSKNTWLDYDNYTALRDFSLRMVEITGIELYYREDLQVANYGIGGHYAPHTDAYTIENELPFVFSTIGDRILTALFYINDVDEGGATAFPFLKIAVPPIKGSAVVWYNLHKDLSNDYRTWHTGCPVIRGSKWIVTQWFHSFGQEFLRPCNLKSDQNVSLSLKEIIKEQQELRLS